VNISSSKNEKVLNHYKISINKGKMYRTNGEGTMIFQIDGEKGGKKENKTGNKVNR